MKKGLLVLLLVSFSVFALNSCQKVDAITPTTELVAENSNSVLEFTLTVSTVATVTDTTDIKGFISNTLANMYFPVYETTVTVDFVSDLGQQGNWNSVTTYNVTIATQQPVTSTGDVENALSQNSWMFYMPYDNAFSAVE